MTHETKKPKLKLLTTLATDASDIICGAILMQEVENERQEITAVTSHNRTKLVYQWARSVPN